MKARTVVLAVCGLLLLAAVRDTQPPFVEGFQLLAGETVFEGRLWTVESTKVRGGRDCDGKTVEASNCTGWWNVVTVYDGLTRSDRRLERVTWCGGRIKNIGFIGPGRLWIKAEKVHIVEVR